MASEVASTAESVFNQLKNVPMQGELERGTGGYLAIYGENSGKSCPLLVVAIGENPKFLYVGWSMRSACAASAYKESEYGSICIGGIAMAFMGFPSFEYNQALCLLVAKKLGWLTEEEAIQKNPLVGSWISQIQKPSDETPSI